MSYSSKSCFVCAGPEAPSSPLPSPSPMSWGLLPTGCPTQAPRALALTGFGPWEVQIGAGRAGRGTRASAPLPAGWVGGGVSSPTSVSHPSSNTADLGLPRLPGPELGAPAPSPIPLAECHLVPAKTLMKTSTAHPPPRHRTRGSRGSALTGGRE